MKFRSRLQFFGFSAPGWMALFALFASFAALGVVGLAGADEPKFSPEDLRFFDQEVRPILEANCLKCHSGETKRAGLDLSRRESILKGGDSGPAVSLEKPDDSRLLRAIRYTDPELKMPPTGPLPPKSVETLTAWVKRGLPGRRIEVASAHPVRGGVVTPEARQAWPYRPLTRPPVPKVAEVTHPIDAFIRAKLDEQGLKMNEPADKIALVRRVYYDLIGLPPTPEQVDAFVADDAPDAYERLIDRLLESPHYGERWGRHWLDLVRYAETNGYERDGPKPFAWRYRDYVIKSFNDDKPFDRFILEQLAGDELDRDNPEAIIGTGYYRLGLWDDEPADPLQSRYDEFDDWVATTCQVFLGMTMNCARCHEHKIDPIPQADYYRMLAFFQDVQHFSNSRDTRSSFNLTDISPPEKRRSYEAELQRREAEKERITREMTQLEDEAIRRMPAEDQRAAEGIDRPAVVAKLKEYFTKEENQKYTQLKRELNRLRSLPEIPRELALSVNNCLVQVPDTFVMQRGNPHAPGAKVEPGFPEVLGFPDPQIPPPPPGARSSGRRLVLAKWIASPQNPLTARVLANRLWQHHFGRGIVATPNDFGKFGTPPTHPELLDWLACELIERGWKLKPMHRLIMTSQAYRQSSRGNDEGLLKDPSNQWFWRFNMRRLSAEEVRDSLLMVSGQLNLKAGGPSVYPKIPKEVLAGQSRPGEGWPVSPPQEANRRSIYVGVKRSLQLPILAQHDQADTDSSCPVRYTTTVPTQALGLVNSEFAQETAAALAARLRKDRPEDLSAQVRWAIRLTTGRLPDEQEVAEDVAFIAELQRISPKADALQQYCLMILNTNEFVYLD
ncbi:MAG: PSD1 and planctomycete cytochrome C domain-containing protein [Gemmataceae bacterium]|nr:PSD1 and planctomycete cytochrome C domain-containing protein [Gemmataceae bacterium]